uniref:NADH-ubiquinone oxidoreductase B17 subunit n=1 Tax=Loa loa TaxID=7209 RepID=A0A1I7VV18_LOALO
MLNKLVREAKWWGETFVGLAKVIASPNAPIPAADIHPRQPAIPSTPAEGFRAFPFRWWWKLCPFNRNIVLWMSILIPIYIAKFPPEIWKAMLVHQIPEHMSLHKRRGKAQRIQDELYFAKYDPLKEETPSDLAIYPSKDAFFMSVVFMRLNDVSFRKKGSWYLSEEPIVFALMCMDISMYS